MAHVVLLRGVNVGGHRTFRPTELARQLADLDVVSIGAAGTFVVRQPITQAQLRAEFTNRLSFETEIMICQGRDILKLLSQDHFNDQPVGPDIVRYVSVLAKNPRTSFSLPLSFPSKGKWLLKIIAREKRFILGLYRREMKALRYFGEVDRLFGTSSTTRNWKTITAIGKALQNSRS